MTIKTFKLGNDEIDDSAFKGIENELQVIPEFERKTDVRTWAKEGSWKVDCTEESLKKLIKYLKPKFPRKMKKKKFGTKRGRRRYELKIKYGREITYTDVHFTGFNYALNNLNKLINELANEALKNLPIEHNKSLFKKRKMQYFNDEKEYKEIIFNEIKL